PPPLVSFVAVHAGAFSGGSVNVSVHVRAPVPISTLPAESEPTMLAPAPQSVRSVGAANDAPAQNNRAVPASKTISAPLVRETSGRIIMLLLVSLWSNGRGSAFVDSRADPRRRGPVHRPPDDRPTCTFPIMLRSALVAIPRLMARSQPT